MSPQQARAACSVLHFVSHPLLLRQCTLAVSMVGAVS
jgi:hypothetical protein